MEFKVKKNDLTFLGFFFLFLIVMRGNCKKLLTKNQAGLFLSRSLSFLFLSLFSFSLTFFLSLFLSIFLSFSISFSFSLTFFLSIFLSLLLLQDSDGGKGLIPSHDEVARIKMAAMLGIHRPTAAAAAAAAAAATAPPLPADASADPYRLPDSPSPPIKQGADANQESRKVSLPHPHHPSNMTDKPGICCK